MMQDALSVIAALSHWDAFGELDEGSRQALAGLCEPLVFAAGETIFTMGQNDGSVVYAVHDGKGRLTSANGERGDVSVEEVSAGALLGLGALAFNDDSMATKALHAVTEVHVLAIETADLRALCREEASLAWAFFQLAMRTNGTLQATSRPEARVYRHLLTLVRRDAAGLSIPEMPRHAALAEAAGVTDVEAAGAVATLIGEGIARRAYPGLTVLDGDALHRAAYR